MSLKMLGWMFLIGTVVNSSDSNRSPFQGQCVDSNVSRLKAQQIGYYYESLRVTDIIIPRELRYQNAEKICFFVESARHNIYCFVEGDNTVRFRIYDQLFGLQKISFIQETSKSSDSFNSEASLNPLDRFYQSEAISYEYYIRSVDEPDNYNFIDVPSHVYGELCFSELHIQFNATYLYTSIGMIPPDFVDLEVLGIMRHRFPADVGSIDTLDGTTVEPASWFYTISSHRDLKSVSNTAFNYGKPIKVKKRTLALDPTTADAEVGLPYFGYMEFILDDNEILQQRNYAISRSNDTLDSIQSKASERSVDRSKNDSNSWERINICIWGSNTVDGQKTIWLDQMRHISREDFRFTFVLSLENGQTIESDSPELHSTNGFYSKIFALKNDVITKYTDFLNIVDSPFNGFALDVAEIEQVPNDGSLPASAVWEQDLILLYKYAHDRLVLANYNINDLSPLWCQQLYVRILLFVYENHCNVIVYGNNRGFSSDVLITDTGKLLSIPTVAELLNLYVDPTVLPDVIVAPSTYAIEHESVRNISLQRRVIHLYSMSHHTIQSLGVDSLSSEVINAYEITIDDSPVTLGGSNSTTAPVLLHVISPAVDSQNKLNRDKVLEKMEFQKSCDRIRSDGIRSKDRFSCFNIGFIARLAPGKVMIVSINVSCCLHIY